MCMGSPTPFHLSTTHTPIPCPNFPGPILNRRWTRGSVARQVARSPSGLGEEATGLLGLLCPRRCLRSYPPVDSETQPGASRTGDVEVEPGGREVRQVFQTPPVQPHVAVRQADGARDVSGVGLRRPLVTRPPPRTPPRTSDLPAPGSDDDSRTEFRRRINPRAPPTGLRRRLKPRPPRPRTPPTTQFPAPPPRTPTATRAPTPLGPGPCLPRPGLRRRLEGLLPTRVTLG